jgi:hypothetical protein
MRCRVVVCCDCLVVQICCVNGCLLYRLDVRGSQYCLGHHALKYSEPPTLSDFLKNSVHLDFFKVPCRVSGSWYSGVWSDSTHSRPRVC